MNKLANDLDFILQRIGSLWENLRDQRIFITGGTGFFGCWLLESFIWANEKRKLNAHAVVLTRNMAAFAKKYPLLFSASCLTFHEGDVKNFSFPAGKFSHLIHAATDVAAKLDADSIQQGTEHTLEFARASNVKKFLLTSSGAVYGKQPAAVSHLREDAKFNIAASEYAIHKRQAENRCIAYAKQYAFEVKIARCFAFVGPYLPLDGHFAIGNFIRDGLAGNTIIVKGDGSPYRSYLYAADLMIWLWTILFCGISTRPYNVGSDQAVTMAELAAIVANVFTPKPTIKISQARSLASPAERYVPHIQRAQEELQLSAKTNLIQAITATVQWHSDTKSH